MTGREVDQATALTSLCDTLWSLRELLGLTEYGLLVQRLLAEAGETAHLATAADQVEAACARIRQLEIVRAGEVDAAASALGLSDDVTLAELAGRAPEPWATILAEHVEGLRALAVSVAARREAAQRALQAGAEAVDRALADLTAAARPAVGAGRLDRQV